VPNDLHRNQFAINDADRLRNFGSTRGGHFLKLIGPDLYVGLQLVLLC
jgi:hypothetical protein